MTVDCHQQIYRIFAIDSRLSPATPFFFYFMSNCRKVSRTTELELENQSQQMSLFPGGVKIWKRSFEVQFKGPEFRSSDWPMCEIHFLDIY